MRKGQSRNFTKHFDKFVCVGDTITAELPGGFTAIARIERDDCGDTPPERDDGFWPSMDPKAAGWIGNKSKREFQRQMRKAKEVLRAWNADEWFYCGVCVTIHKAGIQLTGRYDHALWGIDCNYPFPGRYRANNYLREVANELLSEALASAQAAVSKLAA